MSFAPLKADLSNSDTAKSAPQEDNKSVTLCEISLIPEIIKRQGI
jgi:hypothetical protein